MIHITPMTLQDVPAVVAIERAGQPDPWSERSFLEELGRLHSSIAVARVGVEPALEGVRLEREDAPGRDGLELSEVNRHTEPEVAGYICSWLVADEIQVLNLTVHARHRRRGIGRRLLLHALKNGFERGARVAVLEVRKSNAAALRLYESVGFRKVGERPGFYSDLKEDAILMELEPDDDWLKAHHQEMLFHRSEC